MVLGLLPQNRMGFLTPVGGSGPPPPLTNLQIWLDASDDSSVIYGATPPQVLNWYNKVGNKIYTRQTGASSNIQRNSTLGSKALTAINFLGVAPYSFYSGALVFFPSLVDATTKTDCMILVACLVSNTTAEPIMWNEAGATNVVGLDLKNPAVFASGDPAAGGQVSGNLNLSIGPPYIIGAYRNGANMAIFKNNVQTVSRSDAASSITTSANINVSLCSNSGLPSGAQCRIGEILHYRGYDAQTFTDAHAWLNAKWGIY